MYAPTRAISDQQSAGPSWSDVSGPHLAGTIAGDHSAPPFPSLGTPKSAPDPFLATCALGFSDPLAPSGVWNCPNPDQLCAVAGGYAYLIDTTNPSHFELLPYRPVLAIHAALEANLLLFAGHRSILAYGPQGRAWESPRLSDEGLTIHSVKATTVSGTGWQLATDREVAFTLDLRSGTLG
jgi:hypothetical protein